MSFKRFGARRGRSGGRGSGGRFGDIGPPDYVIELGIFEHPCEGEAVCKLTCDKIPYFNAPIFQENKVQIGKVDEIFGLMKSPLFTIKLNEGIVATSYMVGHKFYTDPQKLLPMERFLPSAGGRSASSGMRGRGRHGGRGNRFIGIRNRDIITPGGRGGRRGGFGGRSGRSRPFSRGRGRGRY